MMHGMAHNEVNRKCGDVKKTDGSIRLCIDYRKLNSVTTPDPYCMPLVEELLNQGWRPAYLQTYI